ncbi:hypothetical protein FPE01S_03_05850 [Flavihumibacter petaseus NBRC 106054]|uniref:Amidohydrolase-related domain-containing protein n=2 Tax=Flavihumibacter TaxID=1004301 RepID=A0A0E9N3J1_9BACT|nr:hypothetical protein FPE01S_03_05850 [Flavihumibacter petaseus NBRC 106054]
MRRVDAHNHFWQYDPVRDAWIDDSMQVIRRNFFPDDLAPLLEANGFEGCVAVQADQSDTETKFLLDLAASAPFVKGVVGWTDLRAPFVEDQLDKYRDQPLLKGFRHILQGELNRCGMLQPAFLNGIAALGKKGYTYDILIFPDQLPFAATLCGKFSNQAFIIDHGAKPYIRKGEMDQWKKDMQAFRKMDHVYCKVSGLATEADWTSWTPQQIRPYIDTLVETFGISRLVFGSDWPVSLLAGSYERTVSLVADCFSASEQEAVFSTNARQFYKL